MKAIDIKVLHLRRIGNTQICCTAQVRIIYSNNLKEDLVLSSFLKALIKTIRYI